MGAGFYHDWETTVARKAKTRVDAGQAVYVTLEEGLLRHSTYPVAPSSRLRIAYLHPRDGLWAMRDPTAEEQAQEARRWAQVLDPAPPVDAPAPSTPRRQP